MMRWIKWAAYTAVLWACIGIAFYAGRKSTPAAPKQSCGIPVYKDYIGTVEHFIWNGSTGSRVDGFDIVFHHGAPNSNFGSFRFGNDGYTVKVFYPDTVCLEVP